MTREESIKYQTRVAKKARKSLDEIIERSIEELEELKDYETWKAVRYLECTMERLENARKFAEEKDKELAFLKDVLECLED